MSRCDDLLAAHPFGMSRKATKVEKNNWWYCYFLRQITYNPSTDEAMIQLVAQFQEEMNGINELTPQFIADWVEKFHTTPKGDWMALELSNALPAIIDATSLEHIQLFTQNTKLRSEIFSSFGHISSARYADDLSDQMDKIAQLISSPNSK
jgi:hypothetical protein